MHIKTIDKKLWDLAEKTGEVTYSGETVNARPAIDQRSELKIGQKDHFGEQSYEYSFKLSGEFCQQTTIVLQFHDWWTIPENIQVGKRTFLYLATPLAFCIKNNVLYIANNEILNRPYLDMEHEWLVIEQNQLTHHKLFTIPLDQWIDLDFVINWSLDRDGFVECNGKKVSGLKTMFNLNPCDIQFGLYLDTKFESNEIRHFYTENLSNYF